MQPLYPSLDRKYIAILQRIDWCSITSERHRTQLRDWPLFWYSYTSLIAWIWIKSWPHFLIFYIFSRVMPLYQFSPLPTMLISNQRHSIIYWWISKSNSSKESCFEIEYEAYNKIHMWRIIIGFLHILMFLFCFF